ncbi:MAG: hypothetical protein J5883_06000 [Clostridiales bacterium]|nr:hypothetical protein [Clostridiales bacterium]
MVFRDPMEKEIPVIRKLYVPGERAGAFLTFLIGCLPLICIPLAIMTIIRKVSRDHKVQYEKRYRKRTGPDAGIIIISFVI